MQIIIDECISLSTKKLLEKLGFIILEIGTILEWGTLDEEIYRYASEHQIPLLTHDRRFGQIYLESAKVPATTIVLQIGSPHPENTNKLLMEALKQIDLALNTYKGKLIIISSSKIRIRVKTFSQ